MHTPAASERTSAGEWQKLIIFQLAASSELCRNDDLLKAQKNEVCKHLDLSLRRFIVGWVRFEGPNGIILTEMFECHDCSYESYMLNVYDYHMNHHQNQSTEWAYICPYCGFGGATQGSIKRHYMYHEGKRKSCLPFWAHWQKYMPDLNSAIYGYFDVDVDTEKTIKPWFSSQMSWRDCLER